MKSHISKLLFLLFLAIGAATISYSAFPVQSPSVTNTSVAKPADGTTILSNGQSVHAVAGKAMTAPKPPAPAGGDKSQLVALILVILVGSLGIHRFYLGYTWQGIVQLLTLGGCGIWSFIDFIRITTGSLQPKNNEYSETL